MNSRQSPTHTWFDFAVSLASELAPQPDVEAYRRKATTLIEALAQPLLDKGLHS